MEIAKTVFAVFLAILVVDDVDASVEMRVRPPFEDATKIIQAAVDACASAGGGRVMLEKGVYEVRSILLASNVELHLCRDAVLRGSRNPEDYALELMNTTPFPKATNRWSNAIIRILGAYNVAVTGELGSEIDGRNCFDSAGEENFRGPHAITAFGVTNLVFRGFCVKDAGNYGLYVRGGENVRVDKVAVEGGHDGFDFFECQDVEVSDCVIHSGDDCVAGYGNRRLCVRRCSLNSACSFFRIGGNDILVEDCRGEAPAKHPHRWTLSQREKMLERTPNGVGRHTTLSFFTFFTGKAARGQVSSGIVFRNFMVSGVEQFMHYNLSGNERWQNGPGLVDITFEKVHAKDIERPLCAYASGNTPLAIKFKNCTMGFRNSIGELVRGANLGSISIEGLSVFNVDGPFLRTWEGKPMFKVRGLEGVKPMCMDGQGVFVEHPI